MKYLRAWRGHFVYEDHETPWNIVAPNIDLDITNRPHYHGRRTFHGGLFAIQDYVPMWANFNAHFTIDGSLLTLDRIDIDTDGARTSRPGRRRHGALARADLPGALAGAVSADARDLLREGTVDAGGRGDFTGVFHLFKGGHDLVGHFHQRRRPASMTIASRR